ncbi:transposase family protein [Streptomyces sp. NPDC060035]|uniref:transposase family protein n=1 Tax=Streptomyces sp. NPDC060035 TaxID=3347044 RepID=UPI0036BAB7F5
MNVRVDDGGPAADHAAGGGQARVLLVAEYYRTNLTMRQLAPLLGVSPARCAG